MLRIYNVVVFFFFKILLKKRNRYRINAIIFLIFLFGSISCYLNIISLNFIALSYLIVYIGAISILFLFILMLIDIRISELYNEFKNNNLFLIIISFLTLYLT